MPAGEIIKIMTVYDEPFWRADGRSGMSVAMNSPIETTLDASPKSGRGVLASFAFGPFARRLSRLTPDERKRVVLDTLRLRFGAKAGEPIGLRRSGLGARGMDARLQRCSSGHGNPHAVRSFTQNARRPYPLGGDGDSDDIVGHD